MDSVSWQTIAGACGLVGLALTFAGFWMNISKQITKAQATADAAKSEGESAGLRAVQVGLRIDTVQNDLSAFQRYAEKEFANHDDLARVTSHNDAQFSDMKSDLRGITMRLDKLLERGFPPVSA